ncbi:MAG: LptF/LptG family permease [Armatimonadetes bacterium]|nr:LptF/LptG family permease [Armatimonadota bacterium]
MDTRLASKAWVPETIPKSKLLRGIYWAIPFASKMDRYFFREMIAPFMMGVMFFVVVLTGHYFYWAIKSIVGQRAPAKDLLLMVVYLVPQAAVLAIPIGMILCTCIVLNRVGREMELMALRASGVSVQRVIMPFIVVAIFVTIGDFLLNDRIVPESNKRANQILYRLAYINPMPLIESDKFFKVSDDLWFYVRLVNYQTNRLEGVLVYQRDPKQWQFPQAIIAQWAQKKPNENQWVLYDGVAHKFNAKGDLIAKIPFRQQIINLPPDLPLLISDNRYPHQLSTQELRQRIETTDKAGQTSYELEIAYHFKFSVPAATLVMTLWAAPLSVRFSRSGSFAGLFIAILGVFLYQGAMGWAEAIGQRYFLPPFWVAWSQNFIFGIMGLWLLWKER